jgi:hypothetical protein
MVDPSEHVVRKASLTMEIEDPVGEEFGGFEFVALLIDAGGKGE